MKAKAKSPERTPGYAGAGRLAALKVSKLLCKFCALPYPGTAEDFNENPFCHECLPRRVALVIGDELRALRLIALRAQGVKDVVMSRQGIHVGAMTLQTRDRLVALFDALTDYRKAMGTKV